MLWICLAVLGLSLVALAWSYEREGKKDCRLPIDDCRLGDGERGGMRDCRLPIDDCRLGDGEESGERRRDCFSCRWLNMELEQEPCESCLPDFNNDFSNWEKGCHGG